MSFKLAEISRLNNQVKELKASCAQYHKDRSDAFARIEDILRNHLHRQQNIALVNIQQPADQVIQGKMEWTLADVQLFLNQIHFQFPKPLPSERSSHQSHPNLINQETKFLI